MHFFLVLQHFYTEYTSEYQSMEQALAIYMTSGQKLSLHYPELGQHYFVQKVLRITESFRYFLQIYLVLSILLLLFFMQKSVVNWN